MTQAFNLWFYDDHRLLICVSLFLLFPRQFTFYFVLLDTPDIQPNAETVNKIYNFQIHWLHGRGNLFINKMYNSPSFDMFFILQVNVSIIVWNFIFLFPQATDLDSGDGGKVVVSLSSNNEFILSGEQELLLSRSMSAAASTTFRLSATARDNNAVSPFNTATTDVVVSMSKIGWICHIF